MSITNNASWTVESDGDFIVRPSIYTKPGPNEVVIKNAALALNPIDWKIQALGFESPFKFPYPFILGSDVAGEIFEVGEGVSGFKKGDRVIAVTDWISSYNIKYSGFQNYAICNPVVVAHLPDNISFARGSVLPLAISTSAMGLYPSARLGLPLPQATTPEPLGKVILVWGGASSCGSAAIQLAVASGATVVSTASSKNHEFVKRVGATAVLDYHNANIVDEMIALIKETPGQFAGALDAIGIEETWRACAKIAKALGDGRVATTWPGEVIYAADGVEVIGINDTVNLTKNTAIVEAVWGKYVPEGLKNGTLKPAPEPVVVGKGLEKIADGIALGLKGVSAAKLVVEL